MKTIFITSFHAHISRNILMPLLPLLASRSDLRTVIIAPDYKKSYFSDCFGRENVTIEGAAQYQASKTFVGLLFKRLSRTLFSTGTTDAKRRYKYYWDRKGGYFFISSVLGLLGKLPGIARPIRFLDLRFSPNGLFTTLFQAYQPAAVFSTDIHNENDVALALDAKRLGIPIIGMWRSWDNPTQQMLRVLPETLLVGSSELRKETLELHHYPEERMVMTGHPHYDRYLKGPLRSREDFCAKWGLDPQRKIILYAAGGDKIIRHNDIDQHVMETLGKLGVNVVVRYPPGEDIRLVNFQKPEHMAIDKPGFRFNQRPGEFEIEKTDDDNLIDELYWSDAVISGPTSILLDGAFMDKPVIAVDFYPAARASSHERSWGYTLDHIKKLISTGGVWYAPSKDEFLKAVEAYLSNPRLHEEGRARIRASWFSHADGCAGERLAGALLSYLDNHGI